MITTKELHFFSKACMTFLSLYMSKTHTCQHSPPCETILWISQISFWECRAGMEAEVTICSQWKVWRVWALPAGGRYQAVVKVIDRITYLNMWVNLPHLGTTGLRIYLRHRTDFKNLRALNHSGFVFLKEFVTVSMTTEALRCFLTLALKS